MKLKHLVRNEDFIYSVGQLVLGKQQPCIVAKQRSGEQQVIAIEDPVEIEEKQFYSCKQMKNSVNVRSLDKSLLTPSS